MEADQVRWLTPSEAARELGVTPARVRQLIVSGRLVHDRTPLGRLVLASSVERLAAERARHRAGRPSSEVAR
jgi:excisionase family DNA binding protein